MRCYAVPRYAARLVSIFTEAILLSFAYCLPLPYGFADAYAFQRFAAEAPVFSDAAAS
jgi:hypothetical protein